MLLDLNQKADDGVHQQWELFWFLIRVARKPDDERRVVELEGFYQWLPTG
jgi:hypothetical protein